jgi:hypothetical protein
MRKINNLTVADDDFGENTPLYRCIGLGDFLHICETGKMALRKILKWEDPYENLVYKITVTMGNQSEPFFPKYEHFYGQCWSEQKESDAMWRIYSPNKDGLIIATTIEEIIKLEFYKDALLSRVIYFDYPKTLFKDLVYPSHETGSAFVKRKAFEHEKEVRIVAESENILNFSDKNGFYEFSVNPKQFIKGIWLDPRCDDRAIDTLRSYTSKLGIIPIPEKSKLYDKNLSDMPRFEMAWSSGTYKVGG